MRCHHHRPDWPIRRSTQRTRKGAEQGRIYQAVQRRGLKAAHLQLRHSPALALSLQPALLPRLPHGQELPPRRQVEHHAQGREETPVCAAATMRSHHHRPDWPIRRSTQRTRRGGQRRAHISSSAKTGAQGGAPAAAAQPRARPAARAPPLPAAWAGTPPPAPGQALRPKAWGRRRCARRPRQPPARPRTPFRGRPPCAVRRGRPAGGA
jgi:hypothetical protein